MPSLHPAFHVFILKHIALESQKLLSQVALTLSLLHRRFIDTSFPLLFTSLISNSRRWRARSFLVAGGSYFAFAASSLH